MIEKSAELLAGWLVRCEAIRKEQYELYVFAGYSLFMNFIPLAFVILIGGIMGNVISGIQIIFPFMIIRKFSGGFHVKKAWMCLSYSTLIIWICIYTSGKIACGYGLLSAMIVLSASLIIHSPIDCESRVLDEKERQLYKGITAALVNLCGFISILCFLFGREEVARNLALGIILTGLLQIPCLWKKRRHRIIWRIPLHTQQIYYTDL